MKALRVLHTSVVWLWAFAWCVLWASVAMVVALASPEAALALARRFWARPIFWVCGARLQVEPLPEVDWKRPYVFAMNHQSNLDIPAAIAALPVNLRFMAKHTLAYVPFLGWTMWLTGMIPVNRTSPTHAVASLRLAGERIRAGASILVFPEGTRSRDGRIHPFKRGAFAVALEARVPVVPVAIEGAGAVQPADEWTVYPGVVRIKVGRPIPTEGREPQDRAGLAREVREAIVQLQREIGGRGGDPAAEIAPPEQPHRPGAGSTPTA